MSGSPIIHIGMLNGDVICLAGPDDVVFELNEDMLTEDGRQLLYELGDYDTQLAEVDQALARTDLTDHQRTTANGFRAALIKARDAKIADGG